MIATGVASHNPTAEASLSWSVWPREGLTFADYFTSTTNIAFTYSFTVCQYSFMAEMHTPSDYTKSIATVGIIEIIIYTTTGAIIYSFVGTNVSSPAILSAPMLVSRVAFGFALPVIFISGSICTTVTGRYILNRIYKDSPIRHITDTRGWPVWSSLIAGLTILAWVIAEAIPIFNDLLSIMESLYVSGFTFYFPSLFWFYLLKEGPWYEGWKNRCLSVMNGVIILIGLVLLVCGTYSSVQDIIDSYWSGDTRNHFTCLTSAYS